MSVSREKILVDAISFASFGDWVVEYARECCEIGCGKDERGRVSRLEEAKEC
jgi:hypothetical protein